MTNTATHIKIPTQEEMLARVDALVPLLRERAAETETLRHLPEATIADLEEIGVFRMLLPRALGGFSMSLRTYVEVVRRLAHGCASTAWAAGYLIEHVWMLARWPQEVQDEVFAGGAVPLAAATGSPVGVAEKVPGGYSISGRWSFASGVMHSEWVLLAAQSGPYRLQCLVPMSDVELLDVWHTAGLRGTGSNDVVVTDYFVPEYRTLDWALLGATDNPGSLIHDDPIVRIPIATLLNMVAPAAALGSAEYAMELFKERMLVRKVKHTLEEKQADNPLAQARYSRIFTSTVSARLHWEEGVRVVSESYDRQPSTLTDEERARYRLSLAACGEASAEAVRLVMTGAGGNAQRIANPLQRIQRDVNVLLQHATLTVDPILEQAGRGLLGLGFTIPSELF